MLHEVIETTDIPIGQFIPTHVNRNEALFDQAYAWLGAGGHIDFTSGINRKAKPGGAVKPSVGIAQCFRDDIGFDRVTMTSDGNGSAPVFDAGGTCIGIGIGGFEGMLQETRDLVGIEGLPLEQALRLARQLSWGWATRKGIWPWARMRISCCWTKIWRLITSLRAGNTWFDRAIRLCLARFHAARCTAADI